MIYPLDKYTITQTFSNPKGHGGLDLAAPKGTPIKAPVGGVVIGVGTNPNYVGGLYVIVRQNDAPRNEFYMGHMSRTDVRNGQAVNEGQQIGLVGMTGTATGPHVHFQIRKFEAGDLIDPETIYKGENMDAATWKYKFEESEKALRNREIQANELNGQIDVLKWKLEQAEDATRRREVQANEFERIIGDLNKQLDSSTTGKINKEAVIAYLQSNLK